VRAALSFLTPFGGARTPTRSALGWFPVAGVIIGATLGSVWWAAGRIWPPIVAGAIAVAADLALTGMLHLDGVVDSADGLFPHLPRERRLDVMAAPDVGAFGIATGGAVLLLRWSSFASLHPSVLLVAGLWCASRTTMAVVAMVVPYARAEGGLASAFLGAPRSTGWVVAAGGAAVGAWLAGPLPVLFAVTAAAVVVAFAYRRIGGFTGDVLGAAGVIAETVGLLVAAAKW
jgi:adenosylcobinamide-GDP ribazoletransferase